MTTKPRPGAILRAFPDPDYEPAAVTDAATRQLWLRKYAIGVLSHAGWSGEKIAKAMGLDSSWVSRVLKSPDVTALFGGQRVREFAILDPAANRAESEKVRPKSDDGTEL